MNKKPFFFIFLTAASLNVETLITASELFPDYYLAELDREEQHIEYDLEFPLELVLEDHSILEDRPIESAIEFPLHELVLEDQDESDESFECAVKFPQYEPIYEGDVEPEIEPELRAASVPEEQEQILEYPEPEIVLEDEADPELDDQALECAIEYQEPEVEPELQVTFVPEEQEPELVLEDEADSGWEDQQPQDQVTISEPESLQPYGVYEFQPECAPVYYDSCECCVGPKNAWLSLRHIEPGGIGYTQGYTSLDLFWVPNLGTNLYGFVDGRGHLFNDGKWAANLGIGLRYLPDCAYLVAGINVYGDYRQTKHEHFFQVGAGLELLWPCWDVRVNGYFPVGETHKSFKTGCQGFSGHEALGFKKWEVALGGFDAGVGYWLYKSNCFGLHATVGGYYFTGHFDKHAGGGYLRAKMEFWDWVELRGQVSYDNLFKWNGQGEIAINYSFGCPVKRYQRKVCSCATILGLEDRLVEQPERFEIIVITDKKKTAPALNPVTGDPLQIFFVDNTAVSGDGTFENPFPTLLQAQLASSATDVIYVFPGDGTDTGMNAGIILKDDQLFTSSFLPFPIHTRFVDCAIPALSTIRPLISNVDGVVTVANRNTVQGFRINGSSVGIQNLVPIDSLTIFSNVITISNTTAPATGVRIGSTFTGTFIARENTISTNTTTGLSTGIVFSGIVINPNVQLIDNEISAKSSLDGAIGFALAGPSFTGTLQLSNNIIEAIANQIANGITISTFQGTASFIGNEISGTSSNNNAFGLNINGFTGNLSLRSNAISATAPLGEATGVELLNFDGTLNALGNTFSAVSQVSFATSIEAIVFNGQLLSQNNQYLASTQTGTSIGIDVSDFTGKLLSTSDRFSIFSISNFAFGIFTENQFTGELNIQKDLISILNTSASVGVQVNDFNGTFLISDTDITATSTSSISRGVGLFGNFVGVFNAQNNSITTTSPIAASGIENFDSFNGEFIASSNVINNQFESAIGLGAVTGTMQINDNTFIQPQNTALTSEVSLGGSNFQATIVDNVISSAATNNRAFNIINTSGTSHMRLDGNILSSPGFTDDGRFQNNAGTFEVESINGLITGVEIMNNNARLTDTGVITYVVP